MVNIENLSVNLCHNIWGKHADKHYNYYTESE